MKIKILISILGIFLFYCLPIISTASIIDTTVINTSFEEGEVPLYQVGSISSKNDWLVKNGQANVVEDSVYAYDGDRGLQISASSSALRIEHTPFTGSEPGVTGIVYFDMFVKIKTSSGNSFTINGYDLFGGSLKRTFVVDFTVPENQNREIRIYDGWRKTPIANYQLNNWYRLSGKVDYENALYQVLVNNSNPVTVSFREDYIPSASGSRESNVKEYHQLVINLGTMTNTGSVDAALDKIYIGTDEPEGVNFTNPEIFYLVNIEEPYVGSITLEPEGPEYLDSTEVTASLGLPRGYTNFGWSGDLSGTELQKTFLVTKDMTIGADVGIDVNDPPPIFSVSLVQPDFGSIKLNPDTSFFYENTLVTATLDVPVGYINQGWTGDLSGTEKTKSFRIINDMTIGAVVVEDDYEPQLIRVTNADDLKDAAQDAKPGDIIEVADGNYDTGTITMYDGGTENKPIIVRAENTGQAILNGSSGFVLRKCGHVIIQGFTFTSDKYTAVKLEASHHIRITRNTFRLTEDGSAKWLYIGGIWDDVNAPSHHNRIDHNLFEEKHQLGNFITIDGQSDPVYQSSQYDRIDHNHFRNIGPRAENEMEAIRVGWSEMSMSSGFTTIEYNLFENCDGDPEIISVKTCDDTVRYNTFHSSQGTVCLRHGHRSVVAGNFFLGDGKSGTGGIRIYGDDHKIYNNYFEGLTGTRWDAPLTLTNGDQDGGTSYSKHYRINRAVISHNTLVNNKYNIEIGYDKNGDYSKPPRDVVFANNLVTGSENDLVKIITNPVNMTWTGNLIYPMNGATLGVDATSEQIMVRDPELVWSDSLWHLSENSSAIDTAVHGYYISGQDMDGQFRDSNPDIGADEWSEEPIRRQPLTPSMVGPYASEITNISWENDKVQPTGFALFQNYPNPFNPVTSIEFQIPKRTKVSITVSDLLGRKVDQLVYEIFNAGRYIVKWNSAGLSSGFYIYTIQAGTYTNSRKMLLLK